MGFFGNRSVIFAEDVGQFDRSFEKVFNRFLCATAYETLNRGHDCGVVCVNFQEQSDESLQLSFMINSRRPRFVREVANEDLLRQILSFPLIFPSLSLPTKSRLNPTLMVTRKKQNDHQLWKKLLIFEQILLVSSLRNVRRLYILMLECKGLINT